MMRSAMPGAKIPSSVSKALLAVAAAVNCPEAAPPMLPAPPGPPLLLQDVGAGVPSSARNSAWDGDGADGGGSGDEQAPPKLRQA